MVFACCRCGVSAGALRPPRHCCSPADSCASCLLGCEIRLCAHRWYGMLPSYPALLNRAAASAGLTATPNLAHTSQNSGTWTSPLPSSTSLQCRMNFHGVGLVWCSTRTSAGAVCCLSLSVLLSENVIGMPGNANDMRYGITCCLVWLCKPSY